MASGVMSWFSRPAREKVEVEGERLGLVEGFHNFFKQNPAYLDQCGLSLLNVMKKSALDSGLNQDHAIVKEIDLRIQKFAINNLAVPQESPKAAKYKEGITTVDQLYLTIDEMKALIKDKGQCINTLILRDVDDDLMELVAKHCTSLTELRLHQRYDHPKLKGFTDKVFVAIGKLSLLEKLTLDIWFTMLETTEGMETLLSQPHLKANLTELEIKVGFRVNDAVMGVLAGYSKLQSFSLKTFGITSSGLEAFVQSSSIKQTLKKLDISFGFQPGLTLTDKALYNISAMNLSEINLNVVWSATDYYVLALIESLKQATSICLNGYPIPAEAASKVTSTVQNLELGDLSKLQTPDFDTLLANKSSVTRLVLGNAQQFFNTQALINMPRLTSLTLDNAQYVSGLDFVAQLKLVFFSLSRYDKIPFNGFKALNQASTIRQLEIRECRYFNDQALHDLLDAKTPLPLTGFSVVGCSVSDKWMGSFGRFTHLTALMVSDCPGLTPHGAHSLFDSHTHQKRLTRIYWNLTFNKETLDKLAAFKKLEVILLGNSDYSLSNEDYWSATKEFRHKNCYVMIGNPTASSMTFENFLNLF